LSSEPHNPTSDYQPEATLLPPVLFRWPPRPLAALRYLVFDMLFPWGHLYILLAFPVWYYLTPSLDSMSEFAAAWIVMIWLRNALLLTLVAGGLHWWLYRRRAQHRDYKYHGRWLDTDNDKFLWRKQVYDNVFWSIVSGVTIWSGYEAITFWIYANGYLPVPSIGEYPFYFLFGMLALFFWGTIHFYAVHRLSHWPPLYRISHELHHRNVNTGPWTGISMHPIEHLLYFSGFMLFWFIPVHPIVIVCYGLFMGIGPAPSHSGFNFLVVKGKRLFTGDWFHQLHHQYFDLNYGNTLSPLDKLFGSWHDGSKDSLMTQKERARQRRRGRAKVSQANS
jgi:sterol desaturase/sphingolipid hydroxylase (fatty acid hydroxylase superfamily)